MHFNTAALVGLMVAIPSSASPITASDAAAAGLEKRNDPQCLNRGPGETRANLIQRIDDYCKHQGWFVKDGYNFVESQQLNGHPLYIGVVGGAPCEWTIDTTCYTNFRKTVDGCNTEGVNGKQSGWYDDDCASYALSMVDH